jgi:hypothetical protein
MSDKRVKLTVKQLDAMMPPGKFVHTFRPAGTSSILVGADWSREQILRVAGNKKKGAELSGGMATEMKHGAVIFDRLGPIFVQTLSKKTKGKKS